MFLLNSAPGGTARLFFTTTLQTHTTPREMSRFYNIQPVPLGFYLVDVCAVGPVARIARGAGSAAEPGAGLGAGHAGEAGVGEASVELCHGDDGARGLGVHAWGARGRETQSRRCPSPHRVLGLVPMT